MKRVPVGAGWRKPLWGGAAVLPLLPLAGMLATDEVNWDAGDFIIFAVMLGALGGCAEAVMRLTRDPLRRRAAMLGLLAIFLLIWAELAVGIFH